MNIARDFQRMEDHMSSIKKKGNKIIVMALFLLSTAVVASRADEFVDEARRLSKQGDHQNAVVLYQKALKLDDKHNVARQELRDLIIESRLQNPHEEITEADLGLMKEIEKE